MGLALRADCSFQPSHCAGRLPMPLQTMQGRPAAAMVREEMTDNVKGVIRELERLNKPKHRVLLSWDNARPNATTAELGSLGLLPEQRLRLPAYSPDMHRVIEHQMGIMKGELHKATLARDVLHTPETLQALVRATFSKLDKAAIRKDVESLHLAWQVVAGAKGQTVTFPNGREEPCTGGDWLPRRLR